MKYCCFFTNISLNTIGWFRIIIFIFSERRLDLIFFSRGGLKVSRWGSAPSGPPLAPPLISNIKSKIDFVHWLSSGTERVKPPTITPKYDSNSMSTVLEWHVNLFLRNEIHDMICFQAKKDVRIAQRPRPIITDHSDAIIHVTSSTICGSDLYMCMKTTKIVFLSNILILFFSDNGDMKGMNVQTNWIVYDV